MSFDIIQNRDVADKGTDSIVDDLIEEQKNCLCTGPTCICCIDFNITFIDLGGTCVRIQYLSQSEGVNLNLTYGENSLKTHTVNSKL